MLLVHECTDLLSEDVPRLPFLMSSHIELSFLIGDTIFSGEIIAKWNEQLHDFWVGVLPTLLSLHWKQLRELVFYLNCYFSSLTTTTGVFNVFCFFFNIFSSQDLVIVAAKTI